MAVGVINFVVRIYWQVRGRLIGRGMSRKLALLTLGKKKRPSLCEQHPFIETNEVVPDRGAASYNEIRTATVSWDV